MEGDTNQTNNKESIDFNSNNIGRTTVARKRHDYFTNVKKSHKSFNQFFSQSPKEVFTKKRIIILSIIVLLLIGVIITVFFFVFQANKNNNGADNNSQTFNYTDKQFQEKKTEVMKSAEEAFNTSGTAELIEKYSDFLNDSHLTNQQKSRIYLTRASELLEIESRYGDTVQEQILSDAYSAEQLDPTFETAQLIHITEKNMGNNEAADKYLQIMKERNPDYGNEQLIKE